MKVKFEVFRSPYSSWQTLFQKAADFATSIGKENLIGISHSSDQIDGVVTVWYWSETKKVQTNILGLGEPK
jgi:hypothetical protein